MGWLTAWLQRRDAERCVVDILGPVLLAEATALAADRTVGVFNSGGAQTNALTEEIAAWFRMAGFSVPPPSQGQGGTATGIFICIPPSGESCRGLAEAIQRRFADGGLECRIMEFPPVPNESVAIVIFVAPKEVRW